MRKRNEPLRVELIPSPATLVRERTGIDKVELERLVQQKVAEIMADRDAFVLRTVLSRSPDCIRTQALANGVGAAQVYGLFRALRLFDLRDAQDRPC